jgi:hypothetical protein
VKRVMRHRRRGGTRYQVVEQIVAGVIAERVIVGDAEFGIESGSDQAPVTRGLGRQVGARLPLGNRVPRGTPTTTPRIAGHRETQNAGSIQLALRPPSHMVLPPKFRAETPRT